MTPTDVTNFVNSIESSIKAIQGIAAVVPGIGPQIAADAAFVEGIVEGVAPFVEQQWFSDFVTALQTLLVKKTNTANFEKAAKAFVEHLG